MSCCCIDCGNFDEDCLCGKEKGECKESTDNDLKEIILNQKMKIETIENENTILKSQIKLYVKCLEDHSNNIKNVFKNI